MQKNIELSDRDFFKNPFRREEIENLLQGRLASDMFNVRSPSFKKLGLDGKKLGDSEMVDWMVKEPRLIRRPVVQIGPDVYFGANAETLVDIVERAM